MAKSISKKSSKYSFSDAINDTINADMEEEKSTEKKSGRPSKGEVKKMTLAIPADICDDVEIAASLFFKGNKTAYINSLIEKDLKENLTKYKEFRKMIE